MRWSTCVKGAGLLLAGLAGVVPAQSPVPGGPVHPQYSPYVAPAMPYYQGYPYPGCPVPGMPYGIMPPAMLPPGAPSPSAPTTPPGTGVTNAAGGGRDASALTQAAAATAAADTGRSESGAGGGGERGSGSVASLAPNMFGDIFGGGRITSTVPADRLALGINSFVNTISPSLREVGVLSDGRLNGVSQRGFRVTAGARSVSDFITPVRNFNAIPLLTIEQALSQAGIQVVGQLNNGSNFTSLNPIGTPVLNRVFPIVAPNSGTLQQLVPIFFGRTGKDGTPVFIPSASGAFLSVLDPILGTSYEAAYIVDYLVTSEVQAPSSGGVVGRQKLSDDNSPFPRDRIIFNYDYFSATPLGFFGADVHRFSPGFEITFFDQWASAEIRMPFSGTLSSNILADSYTPRETVFGNMTLAFKWLYFRSQFLNLTGGCSFAFPTAPDQFISLSNGTPLVKFSNDSVVTTPFVAGFLTPTDRLVLQAWWSVAFDTLGSGVSTNPDLTGLKRIGTYREPALSQLDGQLSYWFYQSNGAWSWLQGLAGFLELHHNTNLSRPSPLTAGNFNFSDGTKYNDLNLGAGLIFNVGDAATFAVGVVSPLRQEPNRGFDYQIGFRGSIFFGPTLRDRQAAQLTTF